MARQANQSSIWDYTVNAEPMFTADGKDTGWLANRRSDNGEVLGVTSEHYGIIQNSELVSAAEDAFASRKSDLGNFRRNIITTCNGARMFATYDFDGRTIKSKVGDEVGFRLTVQNSFDRTLRASFAVGALRLICSNGMVTTEREVSMTAKHSVNISTKFLDGAIDKAIVGFAKAVEGFNSLAEVDITQDQGFHILGNMEERGILSGKLRKGIAGIWNAPTHAEDSRRSLWNLYNATTQHLTHNVNSHELTNRASDNVLRTLNTLSRKRDQFNLFIKPVSTIELVNN